MTKIFFNLKCYTVILSTCTLIFFGFKLNAQTLAPLVNGGETVESTDPIARSTVMLETDSQYCSATIIRENTLLTAAHCFGLNEKWVTIHFSGLEGSYSVTTKKFIRHEHYQDLNETTRNDVALIFFEGGLPNGYQVVPLLDSDLGVGDLLTMAGYGDGSPQGVLSKIKLTVTEVLKGYNLIQMNQTKKYGICHGDSGGPAFKVINGKYFLAGIASYTQELNCNGYSVYTMAAPFKEWIQKHTLEN